MLIFFLLKAVVLIVGIFLSILPSVAVLPVVAGLDLDSVILTGIGYFNYLSDKIPPLAIFMAGFSFVLTFKLSMLVLKLLRIIK